MGAKVQQSESSRERKFQGAKRPGSKMARLLLSDSPQERISLGAKRLSTDIENVLVL